MSEASKLYINDISKECFVCGNDNPKGLKLKLKDKGQGMVEADFIPPSYLNGFKGVLHGGIISSLLDDAMDWATYSATSKWYVTSKLIVNFKKPVLVSKKLRISAWVVDQNGEKFSGVENGRVKKIQYARAEILNESGEVLASSEGKFFKVPDSESRDLM